MAAVKVLVARNGVDCIDTDSSQTTGSVATVRAVKGSSTTSEVSGTKCVGKELSVLVSAEVEGEGTLVCV